CETACSRPAVPRIPYTLMEGGTFLNAASWLASAMLIAWLAVTVAARVRRCPPWPLAGAAGAVTAIYLVVLTLLVLSIARALHARTTAFTLAAAASVGLLFVRRAEAARGAMARRPRGPSLLALVVSLALFAPYLLRSIVNPPRAWDALTYHLVRAALWV